MVYPLKIAFALLATLLFIAVGAWMAAEIWLASQEEAPPPSPTPVVGFKMQKAGVSVYSDREKVWEIRSQTVAISQDKRWAELKGIQRAVALNKGKPLLTLRAEHATYDTVTRTLVVEGNILVEGLKGLKFSADQLLWQGEKQKVVCPGPIKVQMPQGWMQVERLEADFKTRTITFYNLQGVIILRE